MWNLESELLQLSLSSTSYWHADSLWSNFLIIIMGSIPWYFKQREWLYASHITVFGKYKYLSTIIISKTLKGQENDISTE